MFHNPRAKFTVLPEIFLSIAHHWFMDWQIKNLIAEFHLYTSMALNIMFRDDAKHDENRSE